MSYEEFRTGYTFADIRQTLKRESELKYEKGIYMFVGRRTVLGRWRELKLRMYKDYKMMNNLTEAVVLDDNLNF